jgi:hypothetical protein
LVIHMHMSIHQYLPESLCTWVEQRYYAQINAQARFEVLMNDQRFWEAPRAHVGLYSDHGVFHVRDVACQIVQLLDDIHGMLIPTRPPERFDHFMKGYGVILAYLHDIGMVDFSPFGRSMHPEYAAQAVFSAPFDAWLDALVADNVGGMAARLQSLARSGALTQPPEIVLREMLALSMAHSKSKVPISVLNDRATLRAIAQDTVGTDLPTLYFRQRQADGIASNAPAPSTAQRELLSRWYADFDRDSFSWLVAGGAELDSLVEDVTDTLRALRAADALRQRGTVQKSSGGYEVFISQQTGGAVYALRLGSDQMYLFEIYDRMSAGEANIASSELDRAGNLRISFHRGAFEGGQLAKSGAKARIDLDPPGGQIDPRGRRDTQRGVQLPQKIQPLWPLVVNMSGHAGLEVLGQPEQMRPVEAPVVVELHRVLVGVRKIRRRVDIGLKIQQQPGLVLRVHLHIPEIHVVRLVGGIGQIDLRPVLVVGQQLQVDLGLALVSLVERVGALLEVEARRAVRS